MFVFRSLFQRSSVPPIAGTEKDCLLLNGLFLFGKIVLLSKFSKGIVSPYSHTFSC